jgi:hypothetical protein
MLDPHFPLTRGDRRIRRLGCRLNGHLWYLASYDARAQTATLRCGRCNPDGRWPRGERTTHYSTGEV